jgi:hypothetical protein
MADVRAACAAGSRLVPPGAGSGKTAIAARWTTASIDGAKSSSARRHSCFGMVSITDL